MKKANSRLNSAPNPPPFSFETLSTALGDPTRWQILFEIGLHGPLMVKELAERLRRPHSSISKHLAILRRAGLVTIGQAGIYHLPPQILSADRAHLDFGLCLLRLPRNTAAPDTAP